MTRSRVALWLIWLVIGTVVSMSSLLTMVLARMDYQSQSYADVFQLQNLPALVIYTAALSTIAMLFASGPLFFAVRTIKRPEKRRARGEFPHCGYAQKGLDRCPECGRAEENR